jgi:hypothetical protein
MNNKITSHTDETLKSTNKIINSQLEIKDMQKQILKPADKDDWNIQKMKKLKCSYYNQKKKKRS